jgi:hypothetical protein
MASCNGRLAREIQDEYGDRTHRTRASPGHLPLRFVHADPSKPMLIQALARRIQYVEAVCVLLVCIVCSVGYVLGSAQSTGRDQPIAIPTKFDTATDHSLIQTVVNDASLWCTLDTGFGLVMAMDRTKAAKAHLVESPGRATPDGNPPNPGDGSAIANVSVGSVVLPDQPIVIRDLPADQSDMDCIIGAGLLRQYVIEFDYVKPRIRLHERASYKPSGRAVEVPLIFRTDPNVPFVEVGLDLPDGTQQQLQTVVDTGTAYYALALVGPASTIVRARLAVARPPTRTMMSSGPVQLIAARPRAMTVGPFTVQAPLIALIDSGVSPANNDGMLGSGFLKRFTVGFDLERRRMYLEPNELFRANQPFDASGVGFHRTDKGYEVETVVPDTPAARAELYPGDTLVSIDGKPAASLTLNQLRETLSRPGAVCDLRLTRMNQPFRVRLMLQRRL